MDLLGMVNGFHHAVDDKNITFLIHYGENTIRLELSEDATVADLKRLLTRKTGLEAEDLQLVGWPLPEDALADEIPFTELFQAEKEYSLILVPPQPDNENARRTYHVQINDKENDEVYSLYFNGLQTVLMVKEHLAELSRIPVEQQQWTGWPWPLDSTRFLYEIALRNNQDLSVSRSRDVAPVRPVAQASQQSVDLSNGEEDYDMDDEDDVVELPVPVAQRGSLVPDAALPVSEAVDTFVRNFDRRYGEDHPPFFSGTLREAMSSAFDRPPPDRKLLAVYIHNDKSISVNIFVTQVLLNEMLREYFYEHVVLWPWDVTLPQSRTALREELDEISEPQVTMQVLTSSVDKFPMVFICAKVRGSTELVRVLDGSKSAQEVLDALEYAENMNTTAQAMELTEQQARVDRAVMVEEQNQAYQESLKKDRAKEEAKRAVENEKKEAENRVKEDNRKRQEREERARLELPPEPQQGNGDAVTVIRLRTPDGKSLTRKFLAGDPLKHLYTFAHANGYPAEEYNLVCSFPRKQLDGMDADKSFKDLGLTQQVAVFLEER